MFKNKITQTLLEITGIIIHSGYAGLNLVNLDIQNEKGKFEPSSIFNELAKDFRKKPLEIILSAVIFGTCSAFCAIGGVSMGLALYATNKTSRELVRQYHQGKRKIHPLSFEAINRDNKLKTLRYQREFKRRVP